MTPWHPLCLAIEDDLSLVEDALPYSASMLSMYANQAVCFADSAIMEAMSHED